MKNNFTKLLAGIFLTVFVIAFGMSGVFAADTPVTAQPQGGNALAAGTAQCEKECQGPILRVKQNKSNKNLPIYPQLWAKDFCDGNFVLVQKEDSSKST